MDSTELPPIRPPAERLWTAMINTATADTPSSMTGSLASSQSSESPASLSPFDFPPLVRNPPSAVVPSIHLPPSYSQPEGSAHLLPYYNEQASLSLERNTPTSFWERESSTASSSNSPNVHPAATSKRQSVRAVRSAGSSAGNASRSIAVSHPGLPRTQGPWQEVLSFGEGSSGTGARIQSAGQTGDASGSVESGSFNQPSMWTTLPDNAPDPIGNPTATLMYGNVELPEASTLSWGGKTPAAQTAETDYAQALAIYGQILHAIPYIQNASTASNTSGHSFRSLVDMSQSGLDNISGQSAKAPSTAASSTRTSPPDAQGGAEKAKTATKCLGCGATETPEWRRGPMGPRTLCNACGLVHIKLQRKRKKQEEKAAAAKSKNGEGSKS